MLCGWLLVVWWALRCGLLLIQMGFCCFVWAFVASAWTSASSFVLLLLRVSFCCLVWASVGRASATLFVRCCGAGYGARFILCCAPFGGLLLPRCVVGSSLCGCGLLRLRVASVVSMCVFAALYGLAGVSQRHAPVSRAEPECHARGTKGGMARGLLYNSTLGTANHILL